LLTAIATAQAAETDWRLAASAYEQALTAWRAASRQLVEHGSIEADGQRVEAARAGLGLDVLETLEDAAATRHELCQKRVLETAPTTLAGAIALARFATTASAAFSASDLTKAIKSLHAFLEGEMGGGESTARS